MAILFSIKAKHNKNIESGIKTIEVRKTKAKVKLPTKCYIYESGADGRHKVTSEFGCDKIDEYILAYGFSEKENKDSTYGNIKDYAYNIHSSVYNEVCLTETEFCNYLKGENGYGYHITNLKVYDKPKELSEFKKFIEEEKRIKTCNNNCKICATELYCNRTVRKPPQSWCYVEDLGE